MQAKKVGSGREMLIDQVHSCFSNFSRLADYRKHLVDLDYGLSIPGANWTAVEGRADPRGRQPQGRL